MASHHYSLGFFDSILTDDVNQRHHALRAIQAQMEQSIANEPHDLFFSHLPTMIRLAGFPGNENDSPFPDIRDVFQSILVQAKAEGLLEEIDEWTGSSDENNNNDDEKIHHVLDTNELKRNHRRPGNAFENIWKLSIYRRKPSAFSLQDKPVVRHTSTISGPHGDGDNDNSSEDDPKTRLIFEEAFIATGRVSSLLKILSLQPTYLHSYAPLYRKLFRDTNNQLPTVWRYFIAMIAAARMKSVYLFYFFQQEFLLSEGDPRWLVSIDNVGHSLNRVNHGSDHTEKHTRPAQSILNNPYVPEKIRALLEVNAILAHKPWTITTELLSTLCLSKPSSSRNLTAIASENAKVLFSKGELVHAVIIMAHVHSLAGFVSGCGIIPDYDMLPTRMIPAALQQTDEKNSVSFNTDDLRINITAPDPKLVEQTLEPLALKQELFANIEASSDFIDVDPRDSEQDRVSTKNLISILRDFESDISESEGLAESKSSSFSPSPPLYTNSVNSPPPLEPFHKFSTITKESSSKMPRSKSSHFAPEHDIREQHMVDFDAYAAFSEIPLSYQEFGKFGCSLLRSHEFNWDNQGYSMVKRFHSEIADMLDEQFVLISNLTDNRMGDLCTEDVDTRPFRNSVWAYVHRIMGIEHDDFNYRHINIILRRPLKQYLKKVVCEPQSITRADFENMGLVLRGPEKVHITLLAMEARKQVELLYFLKALMPLISR